MIEIEDLRFDYDGHLALDSVSLQIGEGTLCALFGPNGSGKTTLLRCLAKFLPYRRGKIEIDGSDLKGIGNKALAKLVSYVPQDHTPPFPFTVREVTLMGRTPHMGGIFGPRRKDVAFAERALRAIGIEELAARHYTELSGGQRQLVLLARAVAQDTRVMLLDEPTAALDFKNQMRVWTLLRSFARDGKTVIVCTHDPNHVSWFCDSVVILREGQVLKVGTADEVMTDHILNMLYDNNCMVGSYSGMKIVLPKNGRSPAGTDPLSPPPPVALERAPTSTTRGGGASAAGSGEVI